MNNELTTNFSLDEFECKCGCVMPEFVKENIIELAENLQVLRDEVGKLDLTNAYRCKAHNADVGGSTNSQHLTGKAADVKSETKSPSEIAETVNDLMKNERFKMGGVGKYNTFTKVKYENKRNRPSRTRRKR
jgi:uncharacterized protein YcbK (DUF882 family)